MRSLIGSLTVLPLLLACAAPEPKGESTPPAAAGVETREVRYEAGGAQLNGLFAWNNTNTGPRPGVIVVHEWWGHNKHTREQAKRLADAGYVGFALDMYGDGRVTTHPDSANAFMMQAVSNQETMVARFRAALAELKKDPRVDSTRIAAIGYCFGGMVVLSMARAGEPLAAVGSFHGAIPPASSVAPGSVKARMLILTGGADPMVPATQVDAFATAMRTAGASVEVVTYPAAMHGFTNPQADSMGVPGLHYDAETDRQSWEVLLKMLREVFP